MFLLIEAGYLDVQRNGALDAATRQGILAFERNNKLIPKGRISASLLKKLIASSRKNS